MTAFWKRALDLVVASAGLILLSPLMLAISIAILVKTGRPVLFRQIRPGFHGIPFMVMKFRTMTVGDTAATHLSDTSRLTPIGDFLRRSSLDELPQLWTVVKGDMSLVGPRPLLMEYLDHYSLEQNRRHHVKPGITGWAQVHGRQDIPFSRRLELDVWYVDHQSFRLDFKILLLTLAKMVHGSGVRSGQDVREVDDIGLHPAVRKERRDDSG